MKGNRILQQGEILGSVEVVPYGQGKQVRYNLQTVDAIDDKPASVNFDYVNVAELTKAEVKDAIIKTVYPDYRDELACINDGGAKYEAYQLCRSQADEVWAELGL